MSKRRADLVLKLRSFLSLQKNWDKSGAPTISVLAVEKAEKLIEFSYKEFKGLSVKAFPTTDGGVKLEWLLEEVEIEFSFGISGKTSTTIKNSGIKPEDILIFILQKL